MGRKLICSFVVVIFISCGCFLVNVLLSLVHERPKCKMQTLLKFQNEFFFFYNLSTIFEWIELTPKRHAPISVCSTTFSGALSNSIQFRLCCASLSSTDQRHIVHSPYAVAGTSILFPIPSTSTPACATAIYEFNPTVHHLVCIQFYNHYRHTESTLRRRRSSHIPAHGRRNITTRSRVLSYMCIIMCVVLLNCSNICRLD